MTGRTRSVPNQVFIWMNVPIRRRQGGRYRFLFRNMGLSEPHVPEQDKTYHAAAGELRYYREQPARLNAHRVTPINDGGTNHRAWLVAQGRAPRTGDVRSYKRRVRARGRELVLWFFVLCSFVVRTRGILDRGRRLQQWRMDNGQWGIVYAGDCPCERMTPLEWGRTVHAYGHAYTNAVS
jgi:hypothetical protein